MNYKIINSGSDGNCVIINDFLAIDMGVSFKKISSYIKNLKLVFISHIHGDHLNKKTVKRLAQERPTLRFAVGEYLVEELVKCGVSKKNIDILEIGKLYNYRIVEISIFKLYHDVENRGIRVFIDNEKLIYATDTNTLEGISAKDYDYYLIEGNYEDEEELRKRAESDFYYERVKKTHLSKIKATEWLMENVSEKSKYEFMHEHKERNKKANKL